MTHQEKGVSETAEAVALLRAELERPHTPEGDPDAQRGICRDMERPVGAPQGGPEGWGYHATAQRTAFYDEQVVNAIADGIGQVVICGAGYDDRALRFRQSGVEYYELDVAATQADKARRLEAMGADTTGLTLAAADFELDDVADVLARHGHDASRPSLFLCEGLLAFLGEREIVRFLGSLSSRAASGSRLAADISTHPSDRDTAQVIAEVNASREFARETEPFKTILPRDAYLGVFQEAGWRVEESSGGTEPDAARRMPRSGSPRWAQNGGGYLIAVPASR